jgi:hypothetical protein
VIRHLPRHAVVSLTLDGHEGDATRVGYPSDSHPATLSTAPTGAVE